MMATPADLEDFAVGYTLTEGFVKNAADVLSVASHQRDDGIALDINLDAAGLRRFLSRRRIRNLRRHAGCGICGVEDLAHLRPTESAAVPPGHRPQPAVVRAALAPLRDYQPP